MLKKLSLISFILTLFLSSCGVLPLNSGDDLSGSSWMMISYDGKTLLPETAMTASFEDGKIGGSASCNHYFGSYTLKGDQIRIDGLGWTEMACMDPEGIMDQEQEVMSFLSKAKTYSIQGQMLQIKTESDKILVFEQVESRD